MDNALLPVEACGNVIDHCACFTPANDRNWQSAFQESYDALRACSFVCSAWLPRSRRNILHEVALGSFNRTRVDLLLRLIPDKPHLAKLVTAIYLVGNKYIPFARFVPPRLFPNCHRLIMAQPLLWHSPPPIWGKIYPPGYSKHISGFRELREPVFRIDRLSASELFHIIWSLPLLSSLTFILSYHEDCPRIAQFGGRLSGKLMVKSKLI